MSIFFSLPSSLEGEAGLDLSIGTLLLTKTLLDLQSSPSSLYLLLLCALSAGCSNAALFSAIPLDLHCTIYCDIFLAVDAYRYFS